MHEPGALLPQLQGGDRNGAPRIRQPATPRPRQATAADERPTAGRHRLCNGIFVAGELQPRFPQGGGNDAKRVPGAEAARLIEQPPIMDHALFEAVRQKSLARWSHRTAVRNKSDQLLTGLLFDDAGHRMIPTHATKVGTIAITRRPLS
jgi:hypothetical protein